ncbi:DUF748 domain-containing protein [Candidatus Omnitrophota bacterium]
MKILKKILIISLILLVVIYLGACVFVWVSGKALVSLKADEKAGLEVSIGSMYIIPPYSLAINRLEIKDLLSIEKIIIEPSIVGLLAGKFGLNKVVFSKPILSLVRTEGSQYNVREVADNIKSKRTATQSKGKVDFFIKEAIIEDGEINFYDKSADLSLGIKPLNISVITSLKDFKTRINLESRVVSKAEKDIGDVSLNGWLNFLKKDMDAKFDLSDVDVVYFSPYFKKFLRNVKSGKLQFSADLVSDDNDLTIDCHLETQDLGFSDEESLVSDTEEDKFALLGNLSGIVLDTFMGPSGGGVYDFSIKTKFDRPRVESLKFHGNIFQEPIKNIFKKGPQEGVEAIKKIGKDFEAVGKEFKQQFEDIGDMFKKQIEDIGSFESQETSGDSTSSE